MSRLVYIFSLVAAGFVADRSREKGAICALTVLVFPFVMLSLREATIPAVMFWLLSYFAFGFYSVYRVILFSDLNILYLSGFGLMIGRIGDASGEAISLALYERPVIHVGIAAVLSVAAIFVFFRVYHDLYIKGAGAAEINKERAIYAEALLHTAASGTMDRSGTGPENSRAGSEADREGVRQQWAEEAEQQPGREDGFFQFSARYELSPREREIFRLILSEKTNGEIADKLFISENTVKFHVRNILKKTGCKNRNELVLFYAANP